MLKTALKPKWIATLVGCLLAATAFVWLSQWQFGRSTDAPPASTSTTEQPVALTEHFQPGRDMYVADADQIVTAKGTFVKDSAVLISGRLQGGQQGWWVAAAFQPEGAPENNVIPVVRGWESEAAAPAALPTGTVELKGRLLPSESPTGTQRDQHGAYPELSAAWLANVWDRDSYDGFVVIFDATSEGANVGASSAGLEQIWVGPQPQETNINWLNIFYGVEWVVFAGFAFFIWWRLVKDDYVRDEEYAEELRAWEARQALREAMAESTQGPAVAAQSHRTQAHPNDKGNHASSGTNNTNKDA